MQVRWGGPQHSSLVSERNNTSDKERLTLAKMPAVEELDSSRRKLKTIFLVTEEKYVNPGEADQERHAYEQELSGVRKDKVGKKKRIAKIFGNMGMHLLVERTQI